MMSRIADDPIENVAGSQPSVAQTTKVEPSANRAAVEMHEFSCPIPIHDHQHIIMGHGGGGTLSAELIEQIFLPRFGNPALYALGDSTVLSLPSSRIAVSTDSFVVRPLFFPGGSIGDLAVNGTVNDLAMSGARPLYLTAGFILEEGLPIDDLVRIVDDMARAARAAGITIVAGDTKVVQRGHGDGCYINTSGIGVVAAGLDLCLDRATVGDVVILSGTIGDHGMAVMSRRDGLEFDAPITSDTACLADLVQTILHACPETHVLRDPTRGGLATSLNEIANASRCGIVIEEQAIPIDSTVRSACDFLGLDPLLVANEGKLVAVVPEGSADAVVTAMRNHPLGSRAALIGRVVADEHNMVVARTSLGGHRIVTMPIGEQLPRIC
ncbi:MAG TPA: hydrogenase expression/formation protein HypE [Pirellulaceae bacterium]|nr:hydrogenase expression/formation protein HypE [Pirellulaceae bacterium]HMO94161.1 hydrogenase expression/formation protein HypE [Pirellulaceae bacterium]HMP71176.1 hydrogenase expression/formation protein HypE [Pirellulaceae bacterium]